MQQIKMIGLDLDGTLLNSRKELTEYTRKVLEQAIEQGIVVLAATGRPLSGLVKEIREFPGMRYAVTSNGARIMDIEQGKVLAEYLLPKESAKKTLDVFSKYDTLQEIYFDGQGYAEKQKLEHIERYHRDANMWHYALTTRIPVDDVQAALEERQQDLDKTQALFADTEERAKAWEELEQIPEIELVGSLGYNIEINAAGVNKGRGLVELGELLGIRREEIMAIGDGDNDITMLREVGLGVAMENADASVKAAADYVTGTNDEDGAAKAIERFALKGGVAC